MSKISKINADVVVNTKSMDAGIAQAKAKLDGLAVIGRIREGFGKFGLGAVGGFFSAQAFAAPFRAMESYVSSLEAAATRASQAMKAVERGESTFYEQGFTRQGAEFLSRNERRIKSAAAQSFSLAFQQSAGGSGIAAVEAFGSGLRIAGGFAGSMFSRMVNGEITPRANEGFTEASRRLGSAAGRAYDDAAVFAAPTDWMAQAMQIINRQKDREARELNATLNKLSSTGAPR